MKHGTITKLCKYTGLSVSGLCRIANGSRNASKSTAQKIVSALEMDAADPASLDIWRDAATPEEHARNVAARQSALARNAAAEAWEPGE